MNTRVKSEIIEINPDDPWLNDKLGREKEIRSLTRIIKNVEPPVVLSINSSWGKGKTTFIRLWENHLKIEESGNAGIESVYFNAWETDFSDEPLVAFLGEINESLSRIIFGNSFLKEKWKATKCLGIEIAKKSTPTIIRVATGGILSFENKDVSDLASKIAGDVAGDTLKNYLNKKSEIKQFKENIEDIIKESSCEKLVIFVDELDRCRPNYSIELLERIKHLFNVDGIVFVLSVAKDQLCSSIKQIYGQGIDAEEYLRKFIDLEYQLIEPPRGGFIDGLMQDFGIIEFISDGVWSEERKNREIAFLRDIILSVSDNAESSLRDVSQFLGHINVAIRAAGNDGPYPYCLLGFMSLMKSMNVQIYSQICSKGFDREVRKYLSYSCKKNQEPVGLGHVIEAQFNAVFHKEQTRPDRIEEAFNAVNRDYERRNVNEYAYERTLFESYNQFKVDFKEVTFNELIGLVDFSSHFD